jgi:hypothetical protein
MTFLLLVPGIDRPQVRDRRIGLLLSVWKTDVLPLN